jgi:hypothetical protein
MMEADVYLCENRTMKPVEIVLRKGEGGGGSESNQGTV